MKLRVLSMAAGMTGFPNLTDLERHWIGGLDAAPGGAPDRLELIRAAVDRAGLKSSYPVGMLTTPGLSAEGLHRALGPRPSVHQEIEPGENFLPEALRLADKWFQQDPGRAVILTAGSREAAGCLVLVRDDHPGQEFPPGLAVLDSLVRSDSLFSAVGEAAAARGADRSWIGLLTLAPGTGGLAPRLLPDLDHALGMSTEIPTTALASSPPGQQAAGTLGLILAVLSLHRKVIPRSGPVPVGERAGGGPAPALYLPEQARPWLSQGPDYERIALAAGDSSSGGWAVTAREASPARKLPPVRTAHQPAPPRLIPVPGSDPGDVLTNLDHFVRRLRTGTSPEELSRLGWAELNSPGRNRLALSLIGTNPEELEREIEHARKGIRDAEQSGQPWTSPKGSCFSPEPLGEGGVALVYPGAFNSYPGMGQGLFQAFPDLHRLIKKTTTNISHSLAETYLYPRTLEPLDDPQRRALAEQFFEHPVELIESGTSLSVLHTLILKEIFDLQPSAAFGYSLGEVSMLWANGIWRNAEQSSRRWQRSDLFRTRLFGPKTAVQEYWGLSDPPDDFWASYILKAPLEEAAQVVESQDRVYLTILNAPGEVVIAGERQGCRQVIDQLGCHALPMPFDAVIHNPAMAAAQPEFESLYSREIYPQTEMSFYSAADYQPLDMDQRGIAERIAAMTCSPVDFPRLVEAVYRDGVRIYLEVGPQRTCSRWIERILDKKPHAVIPVNKKYQDDYHGVLKVLSLLVTHRVPVDLSVLHPEEKPGSWTQASAGRPLKTGLPADARAVHSTPAGSHPAAGAAAAAGPGRGKPGPGAADRAGDRGKRTGPISGGNGSEPQPGSTVTRSEPPAGLENLPVRNAGKQRPQDLPRAFSHLEKQSIRTASSHRAFLTTQGALSRDLLRLIGFDPGANETGLEPDPSRPAPRYTTEQIQAFTTGDPADCFGELFAAFEGRRIPRLPNGPLRMIDRVLEIDGPPGEIREGAVLTSAFDLPERAWFIRPDTGAVTCAGLMEAALQPCGFLSAYQGTIQHQPDLDFYFRNLDGRAVLDAQPDLPGRTIHNRVQLLSSSALGSTIIQKYAFELSLDGRVFYHGESSFGYFTPGMLRSQAGLDGGQPRRPWQRENPGAGSWLNSLPADSPGHPTRPTLPRPDRLWAAPDGGPHGQGYLYLTFQPDPRDWYFRAHFYQDPVMPGSLGVQLMIEAVRQGAAALGLEGPAGWRTAPGYDASWTYRGQVTPDSSGLEAEIQVKQIQREGSRIVLTADVSLWNGGTRIYQVTGLTLERSEPNPQEGQSP
jgi:PfaB family protein